MDLESLSPLERELYMRIEDTMRAYQRGADAETFAEECVTALRSKGCPGARDPQCYWDHLIAGSPCPRCGVVRHTTTIPDWTP